MRYTFIFLNIFIGMCFTCKAIAQNIPAADSLVLHVCYVKKNWQYYTQIGHYVDFVSKDKKRGYGLLITWIDSSGVWLKNTQKDTFLLPIQNIKTLTRYYAYRGVFNNKRDYTEKYNFVNGKFTYQIKKLDEALRKELSLQKKAEKKWRTIDTILNILFFWLR